LHNAGVELALDDFGTGYASLTHLRRIPIDRVKIDQGFISNLPASVEDSVIVKGIIDIGHALGKSVTAEGIETKEQATLLQQLGADSLQGWHFSKACDVKSLRYVLFQLSRRRDMEPGSNI
jgi:EAL domain-containing protein (putative c-di-GMP-specific phosphodiesterase class I)